MRLRLSGLCRGALVALLAAAALAGSPCRAQVSSSDRLERVRGILKAELPAQKPERVALGEQEPCPEWLPIGDAPHHCRALGVVHRGVFLSGFLVEHPLPSAALTIYYVGHEADRQAATQLRRATLELVRGDGAEMITRLFARGADVLVLFMPGLGLAPPAADAALNRMHELLANHTVFALLDRGGDSAAAYFIAHVRGFLDRHGARYRRVSMFGRSGGAWATTLAAAVDPRIACSAAYFGTLPMSLRLPLDDEPVSNSGRDLGDFEQHGLFLWTRLDYLDLYALAASRDRRHAQVYNEVDDCCYSGGVKGPMVSELFARSYPGVRGFSVHVLPAREGPTHLQMGEAAWRAWLRTCGSTAEATAAQER